MKVRMPPTKVLFLDIDGVLNNWNSMTAKPRPVGPVDADCVKRLKHVIDQTGASIVVSSTWRVIGGLTRVREALHCNGFDKPPLYGMTPATWTKTDGGVYTGASKRGEEIKAWCMEHTYVTTYAIVDDDSDMLEEQMSRFVQTNFALGLLDEHANRLIELLS